LPANAAASPSRAFTSPGRILKAPSRTAVGLLSLEDCAMLTWSFGLTRRSDPRVPPSSSEARFASTSFTFML
jgi:hypothetical protein